MNLPKFSVDKPVTITMMVLVIVVFGFISFSRLGLDMLPDIEFPVVSVITPYSGVASEDIEDVLTKPIEDAVENFIVNIKNIKTENVSDNEVKIIEGLSENDLIVIKGNYELKEGDIISISD